MTSRELVIQTIRGENPGRTPVYGWVEANLREPISAKYGSVAAFEDHYGYDLAHIFGGPTPYAQEIYDRQAAGEEITPELLLSYPLNPVNDMADYADIVASLRHHRARDRFCYLQTNGIFECLNAPFGIENHLLYMALYPDELHEVYRRQAEWNRQFALNAIELGVDMIHVSDDWGSQNALLFSPQMWWDTIYPYHKITADAVKKAGCFLSLHSDGCIRSVLDGVCDLGFHVVHPWQEAAGMSYSLFLEQYADKFAIMGGICIQTLLGFGDYDRLEKEIRRVFGLLQGKRWICCTTHFVQDHCSLEELEFAYDRIVKLARG